MSHDAACPCGAVRLTVTGPIRDVIVCHCRACAAATGGPWPASAARRADVRVDGDVLWERASVSEHGASRGRCASCGATVLWDASARDTVSFGADLLDDSAQLAVAGHIWLASDEAGGPADGQTRFERGWPAGVPVAWH